jgi:polysaccharide export outer membrane protein
MRFARFMVLVATAATLAGCMQSSGSGIFARDAQPPWKQQLAMPTALPAMLRPAPVRTVAAPVMAEPLMAPGAPQPLSPQVLSQNPYEPRLVPQPVAMELEPSYTLDSGDKLRVVVFGQEGLSASYAVDTTGKITMPLIGAVNARGMTPAGLQLSIAAKLKNGFVREPHVAVEVETYRPFFILGEVTLPGQYPYVPNMTVETAVAIAGGYTPRAFKHKIAVSHQVSGMTERRVVSPNYPLRPGDTVHIAERWF